MNAKTLYLLLVLLTPADALLGHGGGLDANGGHHDRKNGGYHFHRASASAASPPFDMSSLGYNSEPKTEARTEARTEAPKNSKATKMAARRAKLKAKEASRQPARYKFHRVTFGPSSILDFEDGDDKWNCYDVFNEPISYKKSNIVRIEPLLSKEDYRLWVSSSGVHSIVAKLVSFDDPLVKLKRLDGKSITMSINQFSDIDKDFLKNPFKPGSN